ncbi:MAG: molybdopterin oxidoreductase, 4Fe-4S ferredoxin, iron-sulfur binding protein [Deferribacteraceae bacterium]|jgi:Fe-S-cluster-containing dehydrogenase component|nr:molybdopterin oxidoreductase, 4Fe-4S ferredoxin, iron-sulfur binding protein [Deferribacteraceae bacterium]
MSNKKYAIVLDDTKCIDCKACTLACKMENHVPTGLYNYRIWVAEKPVRGHFPNIKRSFQPSQCQQCDNPPCVHVCPTKASYQTEDGVVLVDHNKCILCKYCMTACPYDARYVNEEIKAIDKCTFCYHRLPEGREPACVETCPPKVRVFGDLNDPNSEVSKLLVEHETFNLKPEKGTKPKLYYIR